MIEGPIHCNGCNSNKAADEFAVRRRSPNGRASLCRACQSESRKRGYHADERRHRGHAIKRYGITIDEYDAILATQEGVCAICRTDQPKGNGNKWFHVDHDHRTGTVRGLLCADCNQGLGRFQDDPALLHEAMWYLRDLIDIGPPVERIEPATIGRLFR